MADNTTLNIGSGGDVIRLLQKSVVAPAKTQVMVLDVGGGDTSPETLLVLGQNVKASSLPVTLASDQGALNVVFTASGTLTNITGAITAGGTAQQALAANTVSRYLMIGNPAYTSTGTTITNTLFVDFGLNANMTSIPIAPGAVLVFEQSFIPTNAISIYASDTSHPYYIKYA